MTKLVKSKKLVGRRKPRVDIFKSVKKPKAPEPSNRIYKTYKVKLADGVITIKATIDQYPAGDKITYKFTRRRGGKVVERRTYSDANAKDMMARINELRAIQKEK